MPLLSELITVKIAHDLAGGIGALSSTADLMEIDPSFVTEAPQMLKQNAEMLLARLKFYRALFGLESKSIDTGLVLTYLKSFSTPISFSGKISNRLELSLVALGIQMVSVGGDILYSNNTLIIKNNRLKIKENILKSITTNTPQLELDTLEADWLISQLQQFNLNLKIHQNTDFIRLEII